MANFSRTYKLRLSKKGIETLHDSHCRLGCLVHELQAYGTTLFVAVTLLDRLDPSDLAAEVATPRYGELAGAITCFVGFSHQLAQVVECVSRKVEAIDECEPVSIGKLYIAGILTLLGAEDREILQAYRAACAIREAAGS